MKRRLFLGGLAAFIAAPAIVARENIMAIKVARPDDTITGLQMLWQAGREMERHLAESWLVIDPDYAKLLGVDLGSPEGDKSAIVSVRGGRIGQLDRFTIYQSGPIMDPGPIVASNYGRGPGLLTEDDRGVRSWTPSPTAREIEAKRADAWRQMRRWLEPRGGRRWV